jgi:2,3-bisphosphoglycerate-dependent phosphoglycerate mutase
MSRLLLVRHAQSEPPRADGPDEYTRPLSAYGLGQADRLAAELVAHAPTCIVSSPYLRAVQTVAPAAAALGLEIERRPELREWDSGLAPTAEWRAAYRHAWEHPDDRHGDGETHHELEHRAACAVRSVAAETGDGVTVLASHGTWMARALLGLGCAVDADFWFAMPMPAVYVLTVDGGVMSSVLGPGIDPA